MDDELLRMIQKIAEDEQSGASQLALQAAKVFESFAEAYSGVEGKSMIQDLEEVTKKVRGAKPEMAPLTVLSERVFGSKSTLTIVALANEFKNTLLTAPPSIAKEFIASVKSGDKVFTHSYSSTVRDVLIIAFNQGVDLEVYASASGPEHEEIELLNRLKESGLRCRMISNEERWPLLKQCRAVIVGADWVAESFFVNKAGTREFAINAKACSKEFYILCDTTKFASSQLLRSAPGPNFEKVPLDFATRIFCEKGALLPEHVPDVLSRLKSVHL